MLSRARNSNWWTVNWKTPFNYENWRLSKLAGYCVGEFTTSNCFGAYRGFIWLYKTLCQFYSIVFNFKFSTCVIVAGIFIVQLETNKITVKWLDRRPFQTIPLTLFTGTLITNYKIYPRALTTLEAAYGTVK